MSLCLVHGEQRKNTRLLLFILIVQIYASDTPLILLYYYDAAVLKSSFEQAEEAGR